MTEDQDRVLLAPLTGVSGPGPNVEVTVGETPEDIEDEDEDEDEPDGVAPGGVGPV